MTDDLKALIGWRLSAVLVVAYVVLSTIYLLNQPPTVFLLVPIGGLAGGAGWFLYRGRRMELALRALRAPADTPPTARPPTFAEQTADRMFRDLKDPHEPVWVDGHNDRESPFRIALSGGNGGRQGPTQGPMGPWRFSSWRVYNGRTNSYRTYKDPLDARQRLVELIEFEAAGALQAEVRSVVDRANLHRYEPGRPP